MSEEKRNSSALRLTSSVFEWCFLAAGLLIQVITYWITSVRTPSALSPLSLISGCLGVCSVCLCAQGRISTFVFGFAQVITYTYLCFKAHLYGEVAINFYYFFTMIYGVYVWRRRLDPDNDNRITTRALPIRILLIILLVLAVLSAGTGWLLATYTDDPSPYLDAFTTLTAIVAQLLMIQAFRDQWFLWMVVDVTSTLIWIYVGDWCLAAQYVFWCCNCVYGYSRWRKLASGNACE